MSLTLGVVTDIHFGPAETIRAAYRSLMQRFHPDRMPGDALAAARAAEIAHAYDVRSDPARRGAYDATLRRPAPVAVSARAHPRSAGLPPRRVEGARGSSGILWIMLLAAGIGVGGWLATRSFGEPEPATRLQALQAAGGWLPADCGGMLCTYASTPTALQISVDYLGVGNTPAGNSVARKPGFNTHQNTDWNAAAANSLGAVNP